MKTIIIILYYKFLNFFKRKNINIKTLIQKITFPNLTLGIITSEDESLIDFSVNTLKECNYTISFKRIITIKDILQFLLKNINFHGKFKKDILLIEFSETNASEIIKNIGFTHLLVHKINEKFSLCSMLNKIKPDTNIIINSDIPFIERFNNLNEHIIYYGTGKNIYFDTEKINYFAHNINLNSKTLFINNEKISLCFLSNYSIETILSIYTLLSIIGIRKLKNIFDNQFVLNNYDINKRKLKIIANKNENNISYNSILNLINKDKEKKTLIIGFENSNRKYTENDISWIWDIDFKNLKNKSIDKILVVGKFKLDILVRLNYSGIKNDKIILVDDINSVTEILKTKTKGLIYSVVCTDIESKLKGIISNENQTSAFVL